jgi:drug/metabolite transporter (DMT)-like permease
VASTRIPPALETANAGRGLVLLAGVFLSFGGLLVRLVEQADPWQFLLYRSLAVALLVLVATTVIERRPDHALRAIGLDGVIAGACLSCAFAGFILGVMHTTVANALFMLSTAPFWAAVFGRLLLDERVPKTTWIAMLVAIGGVAAMVFDGLETGDLTGHLASIIAAMGFAGFSVALRRRRRVNMLPSVFVAGLFATAVAGAVCIGSGAGVLIPVSEIGIAIGYGVMSLGAGLGLYTLGSRHLPAAELTLLSLTEVVLGPVWVWLAFDETPSRMTMVGGSLVLLSIVGFVYSNARRRHPTG